MMDIRADAYALADDLVDLRRRIHAEPEIGLQLPRTQEKVLASLAGLPLEITLGENTTSVVAILRGNAADRAPIGSSPVVLLRGDMDALPIQEQTGLDFASTFDGVMHACGHDLHTAMLVGSAHVLAQHRDQLSGDVVFMFQPGEECADGARIMIEEGVLDAAGRRADAAFALHVFSGRIPNGGFVTKPGTVLSAADILKVQVHGLGGHGSSPYLAKDPIVASAEMILALQTMVTRTFDPFDPVVISVGHVEAGSAHNVIPDTATFTATIRSYSPESRTRLMAQIPRLLRGIASAHGLDVDVDYTPLCPLTVNDVDETAFTMQTIGELFGDDRAVPMPHPIGASEDFSRILDLTPGAFIGLGAVPRGLDPERAPDNHCAQAEFDDGVLADGAALLSDLAARRLADLSSAHQLTAVAAPS